MDLFNVLPYRAVAPMLQTGDVILWKSNGLLGHLIRIWSHGFNHASMVVRLEGYEGNRGERRYIMEALEGGIDLNLLSESMNGYDGEVWWFPLKPKYDSQRNFVREFCLENCSAKYDYDGLFRNMLGRVSSDARKLFCSEFVALAWADAGVIPKPEKAPRPGDLPGLGVLDSGIRIE